MMLVRSLRVVSLGLAAAVGLAVGPGCDHADESPEAVAGTPDAPTNPPPSPTSPPDSSADAEPASDGSDVEEPGGEGDVEGPIRPEDEYTPVERVVISGATVLTTLQLEADGSWTALVLEEMSVLVEEGVVVRLVPSNNYRLGPGDVAVTARGRWLMAAPIVIGGGDETSRGRWLEGGRLVDATLTGIGSVVLPQDLVDGPHGRCAASRLEGFEIPAAGMIGADPETLAVLADGPTLIPDLPPALALSDMISERLDRGIPPEEVLASMTVGAAAGLGRPDLGTVEVGSRGPFLVLDGNPLEDPAAVLSPHVVTFGDRVIRRAEIEVLRDASVRGTETRTTILGMVPESVPDASIRRWTLSTQAQVFGGIAAGRHDGGLRFIARTGQPRFDRTTGVLRLEPDEGVPNLVLDYEGPPESFAISTIPNEFGLTVRLNVEGRPPVDGESPGSAGTPVVDLALDLDVRAPLLASGEPLDVYLQELVYGNGPIGLAPRRYRFTMVDPASCPPCFEGYERVWLLEVFDPERGRDVVAATAHVGMREGRPARARFDTGEDPVWFDEIPVVGRPAID